MDENKTTGTRDFVDDACATLQNDEYLAWVLLAGHHHVNRYIMRDNATTIAQLEWFKRRFDEWYSQRYQELSVDSEAEEE